MTFPRHDKIPIKGVYSMTLRQKIARISESQTFGWVIAALLIINAAVLGLETSDAVMAKHAGLLSLIDRVILGIFVIEIAAKLYAFRLSFFRRGWNVFDFIIIGISLIPAVGPMAMLRTLRILRVMRLVSVVPKMRRVVSALLGAIPGMASILAVLLVIFYITAVLTTQIFGKTGDPEMNALFGSIGDSMFTLFQLMTLEGWTQDIATPTMAHFPWSWAFFVLFIVITTFAVLNLFIGIIVDAMNILHEEDVAEDRARIHDADLMILQDIQKELRELRQVVEELKIK
jgi:voltage-gated sodium channel